MGITAEQKQKLKSQGFLLNRDGEKFSARIITENGVLDAKQMQNISEAAEKYGNGEVALTTRLTVEVQGIPLENVEKFRAYIAREQLVTGGTGAKVRPVTCCKGTVCVFGLVDTQAMATKIHKRFYEGYATVALPHKFKISVGGCPNNCLKPDLNDFGLVGQRMQSFETEKCKGCKKCSVVQSCPIGAAAVTAGKLVIDEAVCNHCGRCADRCYFGALTGQSSFYKAYIGGRWGKSIRIGSPLDALFDENQALDLLEKTILFYKDCGKKGERLSCVIDRIGMKKVEVMLTGRTLLDLKDQILAAEEFGLNQCGIA